MKIWPTTDIFGKVSVNAVVERRGRNKFWTIISNSEGGGKRSLFLINNIVLW